MNTSFKTRTYKKCNRCLQEKQVDDFYRLRRNGPNGRVSVCIECKKVLDKEYKQVNYKSKTEYQRMHSLKSRYNLQEDLAWALAKNRKGSCEICGEYLDLCVDHCHVTKKVRGFLCKFCNMLLGCSKDNPRILRRAAEYLEVQDETE